MLSGEALRADLALPPDNIVEVGAPSSVTIRFSPARASELAAALGLAAPLAARQKFGAWSWRIWNLRTSSNLDRLDHFGPGIAAIGINVDKSRIDDKVETLPLGDAMLRGTLTVTMPEDILALKDDDVALAMLLSGIGKIAADKTQLASEPAVAARQVGLDNERFRLSRRGSANEKGIDVWTARTRIPAWPVIDALGLKGEIDDRRETDSDDYVLYDGKSDVHAYRGLKLSLAFTKRTTSPPGPRGEYDLDVVTLMP